MSGDSSPFLPRPDRAPAEAEVKGWAGRMSAQGMSDWTRQPEVLLVGSGGTAADIARFLRGRCLERLTVVAWRYAAACRIAEECSARAVTWYALSTALVRADIVIVASQHTAPRIRPSLLHRAAMLRCHRPLLVIDVGHTPAIAPPEDTGATRHT